MYNEYYFEDISSLFQFGKHKGEPLSYVIATNPSYLYWCINNITYLCIGNRALRQIREMFPKFIVTEDFRYHTEHYFECIEDDEDEYYDENQGYVDCAEPTYDRYNGTYAQDEMGYSDDDIDTIFDGDPSAYWNID